jgi:Na+-driven multidrug efflux pump
MLLSFPGIIFYGIALFSISDFIRENRQKKIYKTLTSFGLTPWLSLHLFYIMILFLFSWLNGNGYADVAMPACEALFKHLSWIVTLSEVFMLAQFIYWFYLQITKKTVFPRVSAFTNILFIYAVMYIIKMLLPDSPFRLGFTNGLMSESMIIWFVIVFIWGERCSKKG